MGRSSHDDSAPGRRVHILSGAAGDRVAILSGSRDRSDAATITANPTSARNERADHKNDACLKAITSLSHLVDDGTRGTTEAFYTASVHQSVEGLL
ncbi:hypothetical protein ASF79_14870 [Agreia sp. Leaf335]|nr:hypothetical protein ASF79_14870 [Agreia sp. Leaf335]